MNHRFAAVGCSTCVDVCPTDAIRVEAGAPAPTLDTETCVACGACTVVCPPEAFGQVLPPEQNLGRTLDGMSAAPVVLVCPVQAPATSPAPVNTTVRHGRCLVGLDVEQLLAASLDGDRPVTLDLRGCGGCPIGTLADVVAATADVAAAVLDGCGRPEAIRVRRATGDEGLDGAGVGVGGDPGAGAVLDGMQPAYSRRGLWSTIRQGLAQRAQEASRPAPPPMIRRGGVVASRLPQFVPEGRRRLLEHLRRRAGVEGATSASTPFVGVSVDADACSACGLCSRFCPTGALVFQSDRSEDSAHAGRFRLALVAGDCVTCGVCLLACPEGAVSFSDGGSMADFVSTAAVTCAEGPLMPCTSCQAPTAVLSGDDGSRCFSCRRGVQPVTALHDGAGLMADLLARSPRDPRYLEGQ